MLLAVAVVLLFVAGHAALTVSLLNRLHALGIPRPLLWVMTQCLRCFILAVPVVLFGWLIIEQPQLDDANVWRSLPWPVLAYLAAIAVIGLVPFPLWVLHRLRVDQPAVLQSNHTEVLDLAPHVRDSEDPAARRSWYLRIPRNESLELYVHDKVLEVPGLPQSLEGLSIAHLSDLHFTGHIGKAYFERVIDRANQCQADLVAVTGDLMDKAHCFDWIPDTLGRLRAPSGVFYVLGNHDKRVDHRRLRHMLGDLGLIDLAGRWIEREFRGTPVVMAGNELPWFRPLPDMSDCPSPTAQGGPLRMLLSHSPDQLSWARRHQFDLMLAGHTHGGQIRLPRLGPLVAPSLHGVKYASGVFHEPPTVMHVSRGISGAQPIRWNCPPELARLRLTRSA